ncbi:MAG TPA: hypothetical protein VJJ22_02445 [Candidatus Paceibacterota bacterium]
MTAKNVARRAAWLTAGVIVGLALVCGLVGLIHHGEKSKSPGATYVGQYVGGTLVIKIDNLREEVLHGTVTLYVYGGTAGQFLISDTEWIRTATANEVARQAKLDLGEYRSFKFVGEINPTPTTTKAVYPRRPAQPRGWRYSFDIPVVR